MTVDELVESVCTSINDFLQTTRDRIRNKIPTSTRFVLSQAQWEFLSFYRSDFQVTATHDYIDLPDDWHKEIALWRTGFKERIKYITPQDYADNLAADSTPYGEEAVRYTIMGGKNLNQKRAYFLDLPTSTYTVKVIYTRKIDPMAIQALPDEFIPVIESHIIYRMTPPSFRINGVLQGNPAFGIARDDFRSNLSALISQEQAQRGRLGKIKLDDVMKRANQYQHL